jgi:hypothetical protein
MQGMWKDQLSHEHQQDDHPEDRAQKVLQARQEKNLSCIERKIEISKNSMPIYWRCFYGMKSPDILPIGLLLRLEYLLNSLLSTHVSY